jgi:hypothetical protein
MITRLLLLLFLANCEEVNPYSRLEKSDCAGRDVKPQPSCGGNRNLSVTVLETCCDSTHGCGGFNTHGVIKNTACFSHVNSEPTTDLYLKPSAPSAATSVKPFFLSALNNALDHEQAAYIGRFPLAVINHKMGNRDQPHTGAAEEKQLKALSAIKAANGSCQTHFYLNSQIDFPELALHNEFVAAPNGSWWLKKTNGDFVLHRNDQHIFDFSIAAARDAWISTAESVLSNKYVDGIFVDKAGGFGVLSGVSKEKLAQWNNGHAMLLSQLRSCTSKNIILNNVHSFPTASQKMGMGQLFERWGQQLDHDNLNIKQNLALEGSLNSANLTVLARAAGNTPGGGGLPDPVACGAGLAAFLMNISSDTSSSFFSCAVDFSSSPGTGWMALLSDPIYSHSLGVPIAKAAVAANGLLTRHFEAGAVAWLNESAAYLGCVQWEGGMVSGTCPPGVPALP